MVSLQGSWHWKFQLWTEFFSWQNNNNYQKKKKKNGGGRKIVQIYGHFQLLLAFISTFMLKIKLVEKLAHLQGKWLLCDWQILVRPCIFKAQNQQPLISFCAFINDFLLIQTAAEKSWFACAHTPWPKNDKLSSTKHYPKQIIIHRLFTKVEYKQIKIFQVEGKCIFLHLCWIRLSS